MTQPITPQQLDDDRLTEIAESHPGPDWYGGEWRTEYVDSTGDQPAHYRVKHAESGHVLAELPDFAGTIALFIADAHDAVPALVAEVRRLRAERDQFADRVDTLTAVAKGNKRHVHEMFLELQKAQAEINRSRARTLTESEHNRAWHAIEGAAGEEGADPGTVLNAVLAALGINPPAACPGFEKEYQGVSDAKRRLANCKHCGKPRAAHAAAPAARSAAV